MYDEEGRPTWMMTTGRNHGWEETTASDDMRVYKYI